MTFLELQTLTLDWLDDSDAAYFNIDIVKLRINRAVRTLQKILFAAHEDFYTLSVETPLVSGQANYALPSDAVEIMLLEYVTSGSGATAVTQQIYPIQRTQKYMVESETGDPTHYYLNKNDLILKPVPNSVRTLRMDYSYRIPDMVNDGDEPDTPDDYQDLIPAIAAMDGMIKDERDITPILRKIEDLKKESKQQAESRRKDMPRMVVATEPGYGEF